MASPAAKPSTPDVGTRVLTGDHFMLGDHACAEGAIAAGLDFFGGYPITPSTEIAERVAACVREPAAVVVQRELAVPDVQRLVPRNAVLAVKFIFPPLRFVTVERKTLISLKPPETLSSPALVIPIASIR